MTLTVTGVLSMRSTFVKTGLSGTLEYLWGVRNVRVLMYVMFKKRVFIMVT